jgi:NADH-quinone oxidoreductase subunit L
MLQAFSEHPGFYFVAATLLPLASFLLILLALAAWSVIRPYRDKPWAAPLYLLLGGDAGGRVPAYVATGAIGGAFVLSLTGAILFAIDHAPNSGRITEATKEVARLEEELKTATGEEKEALKKRIEQHEKNIIQDQQAWEEQREARWKANVDWLRVSPAGLGDPQRGTILQLGFALDHLAVLMFVMVTLISTLIHIYSIGYMSEELSADVEDHQVDVVGHWGHEAAGHNDPIHGEGHHHLHRRGRFGRFFLFLSLFCFSMLNLVLADNLFQVFVSWELVGICSYLLIGFYFERRSASNAANKAFITNRIGDAGFIIGLLIIWSYVGSFNFEDIFRQVRTPVRAADGDVQPRAGQIVRGEVVEKSQGAFFKAGEPGKGSVALLFPRVPPTRDAVPEHSDEIKSGSEVSVPANRKPTQFGTIPYWLLVLAGLGIFLGCVGKSAQFPLQVWLPDAMEGPTPVSALIHAATMVAAGVYLVGRVYPLFTAEVLLTIAYTGAITLFVAATVAIVMTDIKKVLAYSTVSQLGYMMLALGIGGWVAGLFHLFTHAFFKALLFLCSGSVIYGCHHEQEMTKMGGLFPKMKITAITMFIGVLAIAGIPLFSGWYSKDSIVAQALGYVSVNPSHVLLFVLPLATAGITTFYMFRMWFMTFTGPPRDHHVYEHAHESPPTMWVPLVVLALFSIVVAWGWPVWDATASQLEKHIHHAQPVSVLADFGHLHESEYWPHEAAKPQPQSERHFAHEHHHLAGYLALAVVAIGIIFSSLIYYQRVLDPQEAKEQFAGLHGFLMHKWYFDELYSVLLVRPAMVVARWFRAFDLRAIDGLLHAVARGTARVARWGGGFDNYFVDWLVNLVGRITESVGERLRAVQTGSLRNYVLFLVLAAVGIFVAVSYFVNLASAGG